MARTCAATLLCSMFVASGAWAQDAKPAGEPWKRQVYFGEQHLHTQDSPDAFAMDTRNSQDDAYNFAKGKAIKKSTTGKMVQKKTPYDWCAVTDHALMLGLLPQTLDPKNPLSKSEIGKLIATGKAADMNKAFGLMMASAQSGVAPNSLLKNSLTRMV